MTGMTTEPATGRTQISPVPPEARPYQGQRAGIVSRCLANVIDFLVVIAVLGGAYLAYCGVAFIIHPSAFRFPIPPRGLTFGVAGAVLVLYFAGCWASTGRTYGDQVLGLRVVDRKGYLLRPWMAFIRAVFCTVFLAGILWVAVSRRRRSIQDLVLRTSVIYDWIPEAEQYRRNQADVTSRM